MKRTLLIISAFVLSWGGLMAQGELDAFKYSQSELRGTARFMSMGGAFGALGGDVSAISVNPAGIGVYKSSEIVTTLDFQNGESKTDYNAGTMSHSKFKFNFNNMAFVATFPLYNDVAPLLNVGFSYNKLKNYDRKYQARGRNIDNSLTDYMARRTTAYGFNGGDLGLYDGNDNYIQGRWDYREDWLSVLGYNSYLIDQQANGDFIASMGGRTNNDLFVREKGSVDTYDFNIGTTFEDIISAGLTVSVVDLDYKMSSSYIEEFAESGDDYELVNGLETEGTGWQLGLGVIFKPIHELRIGLAYHSPTWYDMRDYFYADIHHSLGNQITDSKYEAGAVRSSDGRGWNETKYELRTPDKWTFSLAGIIGDNAILSLDYELVDYSKMKLKDDIGVEMDNRTEAIKRNYKLASTIRIGAEYRITPQFSARAGYSWQQNPYDAQYKRGEIEPRIVTSVPHYIIEGDTNYITWGLGYRFTRNFYTDLAFVYKTQKSDLYAYDYSDKISLKNNTFQGALTLGFRF